MNTMNTAELMLEWAKDFHTKNIDGLYQKARSEIDQRADEGWLYVYIENNLLSPLHPVGETIRKKLSEDGFLTESHTGDKYVGASIKVMWSPAALKLKSDDEEGLLGEEEFIHKYGEVMDEGDGDHQISV